MSERVTAEENGRLTNAEIRERAAQLIEERGWTRGVYQRSGRLCLVGAIFFACGVHPARANPGKRDLLGRADAVHREIRGELGGDAIRWNDAQKSRKPVLDLLRGRLKNAED